MVSEVAGESSMVQEGWVFTVREAQKCEAAVRTAESFK